MKVYRRGSKGEEVGTIQGKLKELGLYAGDLDGIYGGGTESAVIKFQRQNNLGVDGKVGDDTWQALFGGESMPDPAILQEKLDYRCLALTGSFETGKPVPDCFCGITGDFDGQGLSFGVLQWNLGQGSLQPLFKDLAKKHPSLLAEVCHEHFPELKAVFTSSEEEQMTWIRSVQDPNRHRIHEPWYGLLKTLGRQKEFQAIQVKYAQKLYRQAKELCREYGLWSQRAVALMFDIKVQNGSIRSLTKAQIENDFNRLPSVLGEDELEVAKMKIVANRRAEASNSRWVEDVRRRKLTIAEGGGDGAWAYVPSAGPVRVGVGGFFVIAAWAAEKDSKTPGSRPRAANYSGGRLVAASVNLLGPYFGRCAPCDFRSFSGATKCWCRFLCPAPVTEAMKTRDRNAPRRGNALFVHLFGRAKRWAAGGVATPRSQRF